MYQPNRNQEQIDKLSTLTWWLRTQHCSALHLTQSAWRWPPSLPSAFSSDSSGCGRETIPVKIHTIRSQVSNNTIRCRPSCTPNAVLLQALNSYQVVFCTYLEFLIIFFFITSLQTSSDRFHNWIAVNYVLAILIIMRLNICINKRKIWIHGMMKSGFNY